MPTTVISLGSLGSAGQKIMGPVANMNIGRNVSAAGDFNGDGVADFVITGPGTSFVIFGTASGAFPTINLASLTPDRGFSIVAGPGDAGNMQVSSAGDINGDGYDDLVIGTPAMDGPADQTGRAYVVYGHGSGFGTVDLDNLSPSQGATIYQPSAAAGSANLGFQVRSAGDINDDGYDDVFVSAPGDNGAGSFRGRAYVLFGKEGGIGDVNVNTLTASQGFFVEGSTNTMLAGYEIDGLGDFNGDGIDDIALSTTPVGGDTYVIFGKTTGFTNMSLPSDISGRGFIIRNATTPTSVASIAAAGDVNGDGFQDIVVGTNAMEAYLVFGRADWVQPLDLSTMPSSRGVKISSGVYAAGNYFAGAGDFNGDGYDDLVFGGPASFFEAGHGFVLYGHGGAWSATNLDNLTPEQGFGFAGTEATDGIGIWLSFAGDINNDGTDELLIGGTNGFNGNGSGYSYLLYGLEADAGGVTRTGTIASQNLVGGSGNDTLYGLGGDDRLYGHDGNDTLDGGTGADRMTGGAGNDSYVVDNAGDTVIEAAAAGNDTVTASIAWTLAAGLEIEHLVAAAGTAAINLTGNELANDLAGNDGANTLSGGANSDTLTGNGGDDVLDGGSGTDAMSGGTGNDSYIVDNALDIVLEGAASGTDTVTASVSWSMAAGQEIEILNTANAAGTAAINLTGNEFGNTITGNDGANVLLGMDGIDTLSGGGGDDKLDGGTGADAMTGGSGSDTYIVDNAGDTVFEVANGNLDTDTINAYVSYTLASGQEVERVRAGPGTDPINLTGNAFGQKLVGNNGANTLTGNAGNDNLSGGGGADILIGGTGLDKLTGGDGADTFVMQIGGQLDRIVDFATGSDKIDLSAFGMTFQQVLNATTESAGVTTITLGGGDSVQLIGVTKASLGAGDFVLGGGSSGEVPWPGALDSQLWNDDTPYVANDGPQHHLQAQLHADLWHGASHWYAL